jgi:SPP1 family predicted phage head-tail adaptor
MLAQRLSEIITIQEKDTTVTALNAAGEPTSTWVDFIVDARASADPVSGREFLAANSNISEGTTRFITRYQTGTGGRDVTPQMRVLYRGKIYDIKNIMNHRNKNRIMEILAVQGVNSG